MSLVDAVSFFIAMKGDDCVANLKGKMKKLQTAIIKCGMIVKINQNQFYSEEQSRMITSYRIVTPVYCYNKFSGEWETRDYEILKTCSMVDVIYCLLDIYKAVSG